jgi:hypothetical protein
VIINTDIAFDGDFGIALFRHFFHAALQFFILEGKRQFRALAVHSLRNAPGDGAIARQADYQNPFALHKSHD